MTSTTKVDNTQSTETQSPSRKKIKLSDYRETADSEKLAIFDQKLKQPKDDNLFRPDMMDNTTFAGHYETPPQKVGQKRKREPEFVSAPPPPPTENLEKTGSNPTPPPPNSTVVSRWDPSEKAFPPPDRAQSTLPDFIAQLLPAENSLIHKPISVSQKKPVSAGQKQYLNITPEEKALHHKVDKERHAANIKTADITARQRELTKQLEAFKATPIKSVDDVVRDLLKDPLLEGIDYHGRPKPQIRPFNKPTHLREPRKDESSSERAYHEQQRTRRWHDVINGRCSVQDQETRFEFASTYSSLAITELRDECSVREIRLHMHAQQDGNYLVAVLQLNDHMYRKSLRKWKNTTKDELLALDRKSSRPIAGGNHLPKEALVNAMAKRDARLAIVRYNQNVDGTILQTEPLWDIPSATSATAPAVSAPERKKRTTALTPSPSRKTRQTTPAKSKVVRNPAKVAPPPSSPKKIINEDVIAKAKAKAAQITAASAALCGPSKSIKPQTNGGSKPKDSRIELQSELVPSGVPNVPQAETGKRKRASVETDDQNPVLNFIPDGEEDDEDSEMDISDEDDDISEDERPLKRTKVFQAIAT